MFRFLVLLTSFVVLTGSTALYAVESQWEKVDEDNGITVYTRSVEGFGVKQFKGIAMIEAPMEVVYEILKDSDGFKDWFGDCLKQETTVYIDELSKYFYHIVKVPVLKDRNLVGKVVFDVDHKNHTLKAEIRALQKDMIPEEFRQTAWIPESSEYVRITDLYCYFKVESAGPEKSTVIYEVLVDPAGWIPDSVANYFAVKNPKNTLANMKKMAGKPEYWEKAGKARMCDIISSKN